MIRNGPRFAAKSVLIVGGAHGIGRAAAIRLAGEGGSVVIADRDGAAADDLWRILPVVSAGQEHKSVRVDITQADSVDRAIAEAAHVDRGLDVLVVAAGGDTAHPGFEETTDGVWRAMFELNLLGPVRCCRAAIPLLRRGSEAAIVMVSSINALASLGSEPYAAAKAGHGAIVMNLAAQLAGDGIRVNAVAPATIRTRVWDGQEGGADRLRHLYPLGRVGEPEDVAAAIAFLASADAAWITGHTLPVDGGMLIASRQ